MFVRFERVLYVVLIAVVLLWPGVRQQFILQVRELTHTTDVRVSSWPAFTSYPRPIPVPMTKLQRVAEKHGLWEGLAELQNPEGRYGSTGTDTAAVIKSFDEALAADPQSKVIQARLLAQPIRQLEFYRPEEREIDEKRLGRRQPAYPSGVSAKDAQPCLDMARAGAKLDPQNSYYDYSLAYIYVGMHRDDEAVAAINRGWRKPVFDSYFKEASLNARQLLLEAGVPSLEATLNPVSSFSELARMRRLAGNLAVIAQKAEENGDWERGWELRLAAFRMGNQIIRNGEDDIDRLVGIAVQSIAISLPHSKQDAERLAHTPRESYDKVREQVIVQTFRDYAGRHDLGDQGDWVLAQYLSGREFARLYRLDGLSLRVQGWYHRMIRADHLWYAGTSLLAGFLGMLAIVAILSLPRTISLGSAGIFPAVAGILGSILMAAGVFYVGHQVLRNCDTKIGSVASDTTWSIIAILPAVMLLGALLVLILSHENRLKSGLTSIRASAKFALPTLAIMYVVLSGFLSIERSASERPVLKKLQPGLTAQQMEMLKRSGFR